MIKHKNIMNGLVLFSVMFGSVMTSYVQVSANVTTEPAFSNFPEWHHHHKPEKKPLTQKEVSRNAKDYNAIILGDHIVSKADIEGATIVQGNVILKANRPGERPHFDYGASGSEASNLIGDKGLKANVPSLVTGGTISGMEGQIKVLGNHVGIRESVKDISALDAGVKRVNFTDAQMNDFMAKMKAQVYNRYNSFEAIANTVKPTGKNFTIQPSPENPRIGVVSLTGDNIKISEVHLPALNQYDRVIVKIKADNVTFANGAIVKPNNGGILDVNQPVGTPENNLMREYAKMFTWIMDKETNVVNINGFGVIGDFYALNSSLNGNGGNINGRLFANNLKQDAGFEVHNLPEGSENNEQGIPPLDETPEVKPNIPTENVLEDEETGSVDDLETLPPFNPDNGRAIDVEEPKLKDPIVTDKPTIEVEPNQSTETEVEKDESIEDLESVPPFKPEANRVTETEEPKLEDSIKPSEEPKVNVEPNQPTETEVEKDESIEDLESVPPFVPETNELAETEEPKLEDLIKTTEEPTVESKRVNNDHEQNKVSVNSFEKNQDATSETAYAAPLKAALTHNDDDHDALPNTSERPMNVLVALAGLAMLLALVTSAGRKARKN